VQPVMVQGKCACYYGTLALAWRGQKQNCSNTQSLLVIHVQINRF
jgi:hypothetical protein